jgi:oligopeptide/dipeptide ABC transporter ATP-binding protein
MTHGEPILSVRHLTARFSDDSGSPPAVDDVSFELGRRTTLAIVGENGSGKTALGLALMRLLPAPGRIVQGEILFEGKDLLRLSEREMLGLRGAGIAMLSQEETLALSPAHSIGWHVTAALRFRRHLGHKAARERALELLRHVEFPAPEAHVDVYPGQLSFGMRKRVLIAMALAAAPRVLIADEPTTRLDPPLQAQILDLLRRLASEGTTSVLFITNDLASVANLASDIAVMYRGQIVEAGPVGDVFERPQHPYTRLLLDSVPALGPPSTRHPAPPPAQAGTSLRPREPSESACRFAARCPLRLSAPERFPRCTRSMPLLEPQSAQHRARCFYPNLLPSDAADVAPHFE